MYSLVVENIKCIIAAGGVGTRLQEFRGNKSTKILLDVNGTPMINQQISQLVNWGMRKFVIITNPEYFNMIQEVTLGEFKDLEIEFTIQEEPKGISHALYQARDYVDENEKIFFVLGDNFFENSPFNNFDFKNFLQGACIFTTEVDNPEEFGVAEMDIDGKVLSIELDLRGKVPNITKEKFHELSIEAKNNCPISGVLNCEISLNASLI